MIVIIKIIYILNNNSAIPDLISSTLKYFMYSKTSYLYFSVTDNSVSISLSLISEKYLLLKVVKKNIKKK